LNTKVSYAAIAKACGVEGVQVHTMESLTDTLHKAVAAQKQGVTTFIEVVLNQELGEPFRRDAMKKPVAVAGVAGDDMRLQASV
jgi:sulfoacetaldehyde acetyltransferase